jgi:hypothetical protein
VSASPLRAKGGLGWLNVVQVETMTIVRSTLSGGRVSGLGIQLAHQLLKRGLTFPISSPQRPTRGQACDEGGEHAYQHRGCRHRSGQSSRWGPRAHPQIPDLTLTRRLGLVGQQVVGTAPWPAPSRALCLVSAP